MDVNDKIADTAEAHLRWCQTAERVVKAAQRLRHAETHDWGADDLAERLRDLDAALAEYQRMMPKRTLRTIID